MICKKKNVTNVLKALSLVTIFLSTSCKLMEDNALNEQLEPTTQKAIYDSIAPEFNDVDLSDFNESQALHYEKNFKADLSAIIKYEDVVRQVFSIDINDAQTEVKIVQKEQHIQWDNNEVINEKFSDIVWNLSFSGLQTNGVRKQSIKESFYQPDYLKAEEPPAKDPSDVYTYEYYNLRSAQVIMPAPAATINQPDCGGLKDCKVRGVQVSYLVKELKNGKENFIYEVKQVVSKDIPPLFLFDNGNTAKYPIYSECYTYAQDKYLINDCTVLRDIQK